MAAGPNRFRVSGLWACSNVESRMAGAAAVAHARVRATSPTRWDRSWSLRVSCCASLCSTVGAWAIRPSSDASCGLSCCPRRAYRCAGAVETVERTATTAREGPYWARSKYGSAADACVQGQRQPLAGSPPTSPRRMRPAVAQGSAKRQLRGGDGGDRGCRRCLFREILEAGSWYCLVDKARVLVLRACVREV